MVRAAVDGLIDFSAGDVFDKHWHIKLELLLRFVNRKYIIDYAQFAMLRHLLLMGSGVLVDTAAKYHFEQQDDLYKGWLDLLLDRKQESEVSRQKRILDEWRRSWETQFGQLDDPSTQQRIDAVAEWLKQQRTEAG